MIYIFDTADLEDIKHCNEYYPLAGVTTNPSIISKEKADFWTLLKEIRGIIGYDKMLHVQTVQKKAEKIVEEAKLIKENIKPDLMICGHTHKIGVYETGTDFDDYGQPCTLVVASEIKNDGYTGCGFTFNKDSITATFTNGNGEKVSEHKIK